MEKEEMKQVAGFVGIIAAGMAFMWLFVKAMSIAAYLDGGM